MYDIIVEYFIVGNKVYIALTIIFFMFLYVVAAYSHDWAGRKLAVSQGFGSFFLLNVYDYAVHGSDEKGWILSIIPSMLLFIVVHLIVTKGKPLTGIDKLDFQSVEAKVSTGELINSTGLDVNHSSEREVVDKLEPPQLEVAIICLACWLFIFLIIMV